MSTHQRRASDTGNRFLFVNKDASTIRVRERDLKLDTAIQSHVQRHMHRKSFADSQILGPVFNLEEEVGDYEHVIGSPSTSPPTYHGPARVLDSAVAIPEPVTSLMLSEHGRKPLPEEQSAKSHDRQLHEPESPPELVESQSIPAAEDPRSMLFLSSLDIQRFTHRSPLLQKTASILLDYWISVILPERFFFDSRCVTLSQSRHAHAIAMELQGAAFRFARPCALLAAVATHMLTREGAILIPNLTESERNQMPLTLKTMAIQAIRQELSQGTVNHNLLYDVQHLYAAADLNEMCGDANLHAKALADMLDSLGGTEAVDHYFAETHLKLVWYSSLSRLRSPPADLLQIPFMHDVTPIPASSAISSEQPSMIKEEFRYQTFCPSLLYIAGEIVKAGRYARSLEGGPYYQPEQIRWSSHRHLALGYQLLHLKYDDYLPEALRVGMIFYTALVQSAEFDAQVASKSVHELREVLELSLTSQWTAWEGHLKWLIWILVMGALTSRDAELTTFFAKTFAQCATSLKLTTMSLVEASMEQFLYDRVLLQPRLQRFCDQYLSVDLD